MVDDLDSKVEAAVSVYGLAVKRKLSSPAAKGAPEDQLRGPFECLVTSLSEVAGFPSEKVVLIGEESLSELATRPDYTVAYDNALVGYIELKAPGKGSDPRRFATSHDYKQGQKLRSLPNVMFSDGQSLSLWQDGEIVGSVLHLEGDLETAGANLKPVRGLLGLFTKFLSWKPVPPRNARQLAGASARLCRLLRDEVDEQLGLGAPSLASLAGDWRNLLFPSATDQEFADGYAQAVTFGLLLARAQNISFDHGIAYVSKELGSANSLIGRALSILTDDAVAQGALATSVKTLMRVLSVVDWPKLSKGDPEAWLYFYEYFLAAYDSKLRKKTGSYYTPPAVVQTMTRWVDEALEGYLQKGDGLADESVVVVDPAMGTGTYLLEVIRRIADRVDKNQGAGARGPAVETALKRLIGFEMQLGPFAVAQLRLLAELVELGGSATSNALRTYVTNTLGNPYDEDNLLGGWYEPIAASRQAANQVKREEAVLVVLGNPPYKEKAKGHGAWIESGSPDTGPALLQSYMPPSAWGIGAHAKHLYNTYVYFWRWAQWKVFEQHQDESSGIVCFITVSGFIDGPGFARMRESLRREADRIWIVDCSPEKHQPPVATRIFEAVQHPVSIVLALKDGSTGPNEPAVCHWRSVPSGNRESKFEALGSIDLQGSGWKHVSSDWRAPFLPLSAETWTAFPALSDFFTYDGSGMMPGRTWVYAPDRQTLRDRWNRLIQASSTDKPQLLDEHKQDRTVDTVLRDGLAGFPQPAGSIGRESGSCPNPVRMGYRSFDRQWIIPDKRLINRPNPNLWASKSEQQVYLMAPSRTSPSSGPALTFAALVPDIDFYAGRGGRVYPLWRDADAQRSNIPEGITLLLSQTFYRDVSPEDVIAYLAAIAAHPGYVRRFHEDLRTPGLRLPLTADPYLFERALALGRRVIWLHTYGERMVDVNDGRPAGAPRSSTAPPLVRGDAPIPATTDDMPNHLGYDPVREELHVGSGRITNVSQAMREYDVSGMNVLDKWFSYRRQDRTRPMIGERSKSPLDSIQSGRWLPEYTADLIDLLNVLRLLTELEPDQDSLLSEVVTQRCISAAEVTTALGQPTGLLF